MHHGFDRTDQSRRVEQAGFTVVGFQAVFSIASAEPGDTPGRVFVLVRLAQRHFFSCG
jgi:hypothetical protein